jgi:hypothetical protein
MGLEHVFNFSLAQKYKIANNSTTTEAVGEKVSTDLNP